MTTWKRTVSVFAAGIMGMGLLLQGEHAMPICKAEQKKIDVSIEQFAGNEAIVQLKTNSSQSLSYQGCQVEQLSEEYWSVTASNQKQLKKVFNKLEKRTDVVSVQPNYQYTVMDSEIPNDSKFSKQWGLKNDGIQSFSTSSGDNVQSTAGVDIDAVEAWNTFKSNEEVVVAVIDTGIDYKHEDLKNAMWKNPGEIAGNGKDDDGNGYVDDVYGWDFYHNDKSVCAYTSKGTAKSADNDNHGTHCAGIIAATANNKVGIAGVASNVNVKIMAIKALGGVNRGTTTATLIKSIKYAMAMGADIINASWGGGVSSKDDTALKKIIKWSGVLFVAAAGNSGKNNDEELCYRYCYSTELSNVISVGSVDCDGSLSEFSNYGTSVDILAPGAQIYSTKVGSYGYMSGTSMAAPMVAGVAAMLYAGKSYTYPKEVKNTILSTYKQLSTISSKKVACPGVVDAYLAVLERNNLAQDKDAPNITELWSDYSGTVKIKVNDLGSSGVSGIFYAKGNRGASYFRHGARGTIVTSNKAKLSKTGNYTFFVKDNAGNETVQHIYVQVDKVAPVIKADRTKKNKVRLTIKDSGMGIDYVRYTYSNQNAAYFAKGKGQILELNKKGQVVLGKTKGCVTVYAVDRAGNVRMKVYKLG